VSPLPQAPLADPALRAALATGLDTRPSPRAARLAGFLANAFGSSAVALVHYGSHAHQSDARPESAHDFFVIVDDYRDAYRSLAATVGTRYRPGVAAVLNRVLPPNVVAVQEAGATPPLRAKVAVFSLGAFRRACSPRAADHFVRGRLFQPAQLVWARDAESRQAVLEAVLEARAGSFEWGRASLPSRFDAEIYCRTLLAASFASEIRPETRDRISALLDAQWTTIVPMYAALLQWLGRAAILERQGETYTDPHSRRLRDRLRSATYFRQSKLRATLRWVKYVALYDDWLDYVLHKITRRSGVAIELSPRERRWPLIFLWPKVIRFLRSRPQRQG
jgi:hypothetical protein